MVLLETVGVGQGEIEVAGLADVVCVVLAPGLGDGVQMLKAGLLETADVFVVNKADRPGEDGLCAQLAGVLAMSNGTAGGPASDLPNQRARREGLDDLVNGIERIAAAGTPRPSTGGSNRSAVTSATRSANWPAGSSSPSWPRPPTTRRSTVPSAAMPRRTTSPASYCSRGRRGGASVRLPVGPGECYTGPQ